MSAGHPLPYRLSSEAAAPIGRSGPLLGLDPQASWPLERLSLEPGESIVLYSDGVLDTMGGQRERYGERRLDRLLQEGCGDSASELVDRIDAALLEFQEAEQRDDVAVLVLKRQD